MLRKLIVWNAKKIRSYSGSCGETVVNNCLFVDNVAKSTAAGQAGSGGAIRTNSDLKVFDSIFKKNRAIQITPTTFGGGGAISLGGRGAESANILVLSSVFELN